MSPTLYFRLSAARWAWAAPMKVTGPLRPNSKPAPAPARTRSRRETSNMFSSWDGPRVGLASTLFPRALLIHPIGVAHEKARSDHGKVMTAHLRTRRGGPFLAGGPTGPRRG